MESNICFCKQVIFLRNMILKNIESLNDFKIVTIEDQLWSVLVIIVGWISVRGAARSVRRPAGPQQ